MLPARVEVEPAVGADRDEGRFQLALELAALRRHPRLRLCRHLPEIGLEHEIDHALGRGIAILQRDLFGKYLDLGDRLGRDVAHRAKARDALRSEEHTSELQSLMRISYAVFCLKKKKKRTP